MKHYGIPGFLLSVCAISASCERATTAVAPVANALRITPESLFFDAVGDTARLRAVMIDGRGNVVPGLPPRITWSTNTLAVRVDTGGLVRATSPGAFVVSATTGRLAGAATGSVVQTPTAVIVSPPIDSVVGNTGHVLFTAVVRDRLGATIANPVLTWQSSNDSVATVEEGRTLSQGSGVATITAVAGAARGEARVLVVRPPTYFWVRSGTPALEGDTLRQISVRIEDRHGRPVLRDETVRVVARFANGDSSVQTVRSRGSLATADALPARTAGVARVFVTGGPSGGFHFSDTARINVHLWFSQLGGADS